MSHWKQRKPQWAIELRESRKLVPRNSGVALYPTKKEAKASMVMMYPRQYRLVKVWIKYEEVKP